MSLQDHSSDDDNAIGAAAAIFDHAVTVKPNATTEEYIRQKK